MQKSAQNLVNVGEILTMTLPHVPLDSESPKSPFGNVTCTKKKQPCYPWLISLTLQDILSSHITCDFFSFCMHCLAHTDT